MARYIVQSRSIQITQLAAIADTMQGNHDGQRYIDTERQVPDTVLAQLSAQYQVDINAVPESFDANAAALLVSDMDSTLIGIECIDEIADFVNMKPQVAAITAAAMRGELDFEASLRQRVALLAGLDEQVLEAVYQQRLVLNPGAEQLMAGLSKKQIKTALVSGGFTFFTDKLKARLNLDYSLANTLEVKEGKLTGKIAGPICGPAQKADFLLACCQKMAIAPKQVIAIGDGANDLDMMEKAGLSIAYHAKPAVQKKAMVAINYTGLDAVLAYIDSVPNQD